MQPIAFESHLTQRDLFRVAAVLALRNPMSLTAIAAGPVLWLAGTLAGGTMVRSFAMSIMFLVIAVPVAVLLTSSYAVYRPTAAELFLPVRWEFSDEGVRLEQQDAEPRFAAWDDFAGWRRVASCYLLHTATRHYLVLPRAAVPSDRANDFEELLSAHLRAMH